MGVNYDYYRIFYHVAKYGSFSKAAEMLFCNQPNLTRTIKQLEDQLGCTLFIRSNKGVSLTEDGKKLFSHISIAMDHIQSGEEDILLRNTLQKGLLSIGASEIALRCYLLPLLNKFRQQYPGIRIKISNVSTPEALKMLDDELVDLAMVTTPLNPGKNLNSICVKRFSEVPVCGDGFQPLAASTDNISLSTLSQYPLVSLGTHSSTYEYYQIYFAEHGLSFSPDIEAATADQLIPLISYNLGVGFVPEELLCQQDGKGLHVLPLTCSLPTREIVLVSNKNAHISPAASELHKMILSHSL